MIRNRFIKIRGLIMDENSLLYWIGLHAVPGIGPKKAQQLLEAFQTPEGVFSQSEETLLQVNGIPAEAVRSIAKGPDREAGKKILEKAQALGIRILTLSDPTYPELLRQIYAPPPVLYVKGSIEPKDTMAFAVVGSRKVSNYGTAATQQLVEDLANAQVTVVSGLARGVDSIAHETALNAGGRTLAVLGCGLDVCYPPENAELAERIAQNGALVSEFPLGSPPETFHFPIRNRIISGLSRGTLVTEAGEHSGALITAQYALEQGRDIFAVPGPITWSGFAGCNRLIQQGAVLAQSGRDILDSLNRIFSEKKERVIPKPLPLFSNEEESLVYQALSPEPIHVDVLAQKCARPPNRVLGILLGLELRGLIQQMAGKHFVRAS